MTAYPGLAEMDASDSASFGCAELTGGLKQRMCDISDYYGNVLIRHKEIDMFELYIGFSKNSAGKATCDFPMKCSGRCLECFCPSKSP